MRSSAPAVVRVLALLALALVVSLLAPSTAPAEGAVSSSAAARRVPADPDVNARDCALLGRKYLGKRGCARHRCLPGAVPFKNSRDAEMCTLRGKKATGYATAVEFRRCKALGRRWIAEVNWCASNPNRSVPLIRDAPQCVGKKKDYVTLRETEGRYDMCLGPSLTDKIIKIARREGTTIAAQITRRSRLQCSYRPKAVFTEGRCRKRLSSGPANSDGSLFIGDSIGWRGTDELDPLVKDLRIDSIPSRNFTAFKARLQRYRVDFGAPRGLIVELGTNGAAGKFTQRDFNRVIRSLPDRTVVMFVLPHRAGGEEGKRAEFTKRYESWMKEIARKRAATCTADWPAVVTKNPGILADGVHPKHEHEDLWAAWVAGQWRQCKSQAR